MDIRAGRRSRPELILARGWKRGVRPHHRDLMALQDLVDSLGLSHLFTG